MNTIDTVHQLRNYIGINDEIISLLGYYEKGDKRPLNYIFKSGNYIEDNGGVITPIGSSNGSWIAIFGEVITSKDFGIKTDVDYDQQDDLQSCFNYAPICKTLLINKGTYFIRGTGNIDIKQYIFDEGGLKVLSNSNIEFEKGAELRILPTSYEAYNAIRIWNADNVSIKNGALIGEKNEHIGIDGEFGFGIWICGSRNVTIDNILIKDFWGDGIDIQYANLQPDLIGCENITITNVKCEGNRRNGCSIETGRNIFIKQCSFINSGYKAPQSGIDIEPWYEYAICEDIFIDECYFLDNKASGIIVNFPTLKNIQISKCIFKSSTVGFVGNHLYQTYGGGEFNEMVISYCDFDENATNVLINAGSSLFESNIFRNTVKTDKLDDWFYKEGRFNNNKFINTELFIGGHEASITFLNNNVFENSYVNIVAGRGFITENKFLKGDATPKISLHSGVVDFVIKNNIFKNIGSAIQSYENISVIDNYFLDTSTVLYLFYDNSKKFEFIGNNIIDCSAFSAINSNNVNAIYNSLIFNNTFSNSIYPDRVLFSGKSIFLNDSEKGNKYMIGNTAFTNSLNNLANGYDIGTDVYDIFTTNKKTIIGFDQNGYIFT